MRKRKLLERHEKLIDKAFTIAAKEALAYTAKWHATHEWAIALVEHATGEWGPWRDPSNRVEKVRGGVVRDLEDEGEAYRKRRPIELLESWLARLPRDNQTGRRRTVIRILTWELDRQDRVAYNPEWLKIGDDMSPRAAQAHARRWARDYAEALDDRTASRELIMTAIEIAFWTAANATAAGRDVPYV